MNGTTKQHIRAKVDSYLKRAEEIKNMAESKPLKNQAVASDGTGRGSPKGNKSNDDDSGDLDKKRMMQKFQGLFYHVYPSNVNIVVNV